MSPLLDPAAPVSPLLVTALLLAAREHLERLGLPHPSGTQILGATGATRSRAYELRDALLRSLPALLRPPGRPVTPAAAPTNDTAAVSQQVLGFLMAHPGAVCGTAERRRYSDGFRHLALSLRHEHADLDYAAFAAAVHVPAPTLAEWLRAAAPEEDREPAVASGDTGNATGPHVEVVLGAWKTWTGSFTTFCEHLRQHLSVPFGRTCGSASCALRSKGLSYLQGLHWVGMWGSVRWRSRC